MQYLDIAGVQVLWGKIKSLAAAGKTVVSVDTTSAGAFDGITLTPIVHDGANEDGHTEYKIKLTLTDFLRTSDLATYLTSYASASDLSDLSAIVSTLVGSDSNKSVRTIAAEELAAQLIPQSAQEALDTLQEIAAWIQSHPGDAAAMNAKISALEAVTALPGDGEDPAAGTIAAYAKDLVDDESTRAQAEEARIDNILTKQKNVNGATEDGVLIRLSAVETALGQTEGEMSIADQVAAVQNAISDLDWTAETSDNGDNGATHVLTGIRVVDGCLDTNGVDEMEISPISTASLNAVLV